jgi:cytochrome P450
MVAGSASLILLDGVRWQNMRKAVNRAFLVDALAKMHEHMVSVTEEVNSYLSSFVGGVVDMQHLSMLLALQIISRTAFGTPPSPLDQETAVSTAVREVFDEIQRRIEDPLNILSVYVGAKRRAYDKNVSLIREAVSAIIQEKASMCNNTDLSKIDFLDLLLAAGEDGTSLPQNDILTQAITFFIAGHETTASALGAAFYELSCHPTVQDKVREEVQQVCKGSPIPSFQQLSQLRYLDAVIKETLRLHPSATFVGREPTEHWPLKGNIVIPAHSFVLCDIYHMHRDERFWKNPLEFIPERFLNPS